jgi:hypothetical protein
VLQKKANWLFSLTPLNNIGTSFDAMNFLLLVIFIGLVHSGVQYAKQKFQPCYYISFFSNGVWSNL